MADPAAVKNQRVVEEGPPLLGEERFEILFNLVGVVVTAEVQSPSQPSDVGVDGDCRTAKRVAGYNVRGLATHSGKGQQVVVVFRHEALVQVNDPLCCGDDVFGFVAKQSDGLDEGLDLFGPCLGERCSIGVRREQGRCRRIDAHVGRLCREDRGDQQFKRGMEVEFGGGVGIAAVELCEHLLSAEAFVGVAFAGHGVGKWRTKGGLP